MLQVMMFPSDIYTFKPSILSFHFQIQELDFVTNLSFRIYTPEEFTRIAGALTSQIGLVQRDISASYSIELFCKFPGQYKIIVNSISYYDPVYRKIKEIERTFFLNVVERPTKQQNPIANKEICVQMLTNNKQLLHSFMNKHFDIREIRILMFKMKIDFDIFSNDGKPLLIVEIIEYCERHNRFDELVKAVCQARPNATL
ncbi:MAG: hypothetical protein CL608_09245 [Anaerolineaceae bacterium]|nr:hypothetical protein [Anaerolineaceae bacterium]